MRAFTTLSLTHSDGHVHFYGGYLSDNNVDERAYRYGFWDGDIGAPIGEPQQHYWYDFWDADLGRPVNSTDTKGQFYDNRNGLFIREFTNGWTVYNRSGKEQQIILPIKTTGITNGTTKFMHVIDDLDGEIYLKTEITADINGDSVVNILDLVIIANSFGKAEPDLNGDSVVNILDLVIVANVLGK